MNRAMALNLTLAVLCLATLCCACLLGSTALSAGAVLSSLVGNGNPMDQVVVWSIRLPRALAAFLVGFCLGVGGAALQGLLRNPLAEPGVLGVSASATLLATLAIYYNLVALSPWILPAAAIVGALLSTTVLAAAAARTHSAVTLILIGFGLSSFAGAIMSLLLNLAPTPFSLADMVNWTLGSVANRSFADIGLALPFLFAGCVLLFRQRSGYTLLALGEEAAAAAGLGVARLRLLTVLGTGLAVGASVSLAGAIGFVGLIAPHVVRPLVSHDPARSLLPAGLLAGLLLMLADIGVRLLSSAYELNLGVLAALLGAPVFIALVVRRENSHG
ncbi:MAG: iron ABC transporter permease [Pseudomonadota bacterium]